MKSIFLFLTLLSVNAYPTGRVLSPSAASPMQPTYQNTPVQLASEMGKSQSHLLINNTTSSEIACVYSKDDSPSVPSDTQSDLISSEVLKVPATTSYTLLELHPGPRIWCRSNTGAPIVSGKVFLHVW